MTLIWAALAWVFAAVLVAVLPLRLQYVPAALLMLIAPVLIFLIGREYGWLMALPALAAFVSMFRNPLRYLWQRLMGRKVDLGK